MSKMCRHMAPSENKEFGSRRGSRVELRSNQVQYHEEDPESNKDTKVSPDMRIGVLVLGFYKSISRNGPFSRNSASGSTYEGVAG
jgi:hypothetical protein